MSTINLPEPHSYWRNIESNRIVCVTGFHIEPNRVGRKPTVLVEFRHGVKAWHVGSAHSKLWDIEYEPAGQGDWIKQEAQR